MLTTNRDLYLFIAALAEEHPAEAVPLADYLANLRAHAVEFGGLAALSLNQLGALLKAGFTPCATPHGRGEATEDFLAWDARVASQIADLHAMDAAGTLRDEMRYFGVDAPGGGRWYNFIPSSYLECAAAGSLGGWEEGDATGRMRVPGEVAVLAADGSIQAVDPRDVVEPTAGVDAITWEDFVDFIECGQWYE